MYRFTFVFMLALLLLSGCAGGSSPTPTVTPTATERLPSVTPKYTALLPELPSATPAASATSAATATFTSSPTPAPTATATPTPSATATASQTPTATATASPTPAPTRPPATRPPAGTAAPAATAAPAPGTGWQGEYFANPDLYGKPALVRTDAALNFDWGLAAPAAGLPADRFSARWTRTVSLGAGRYRFHATVDDGVRVYVDGLPIIDRWQPSGAVTYNTNVALSGGTHFLRVDYYDNIERAAVRVWWEGDNGSPTDPAHTGMWRGDYFNNRGLSGDPTFSRDDPAPYFDWGEGGPGGGIGGQDFSVRWTRPLFIPGGKYLFRVRADDGVRVWLDGAAIIDQWRESAGQTTHTRELEISEGNHVLTVEYFQGGGSASVRMTWQPMTVEWIGNLYTCQLEQDSWIKVYRLAPNDQWEDLNPDGYGPNAAGGQLTLFGVPVDASFGWDGQPYKVELWIKGQRIRAEGDFLAGQPAIRIMPGADVRTSWPCGAALPRQ